MVLCPNCGNPASSDASICLSCGAIIPAMQTAASPAAAIPPDMYTPEPLSGVPVSSELDDFLNPEEPAAAREEQPEPPASLVLRQPTAKADPLPTASRPIWETLPMTDDLLLEDEMLLDEPVMTSPLFQPSTFPSSVSYETSMSERPLVPGDVPAYFPPSFSPVPSNIPKSETPPVDFELAEENPGLISRGTIEGAGRADEYLKRNEYTEDKALTGYAGAIFSADEKDKLLTDNEGSTLKSRPIPPIAAGMAAPVPEQAARSESEEAFDADTNASSESCIPETLPSATVPLWAKNADDLSDIPEELFFEDLETTLENNLQMPACNPQQGNPAAGSDVLNQPFNDVWSNDQL